MVEEKSVSIPNGCYRDLDFLVTTLPYKIFLNEAKSSWSTTIKRCQGSLLSCSALQVEESKKSTLQKYLVGLMIPEELMS